MTNVFDLPTTVEGQSIGSSRASYIQLAPSRDVSGNIFQNGPMTFKWSNGSSTYVVPNKCYFRMRIKLTRVSQLAPLILSPLTTDDDIAPNINMGHHMFQSAEWKIGEKTISNVTNYIPQIGALDMRLNKSKQWQESVGAGTNFSQFDFNSRLGKVCKNVDSISSRAVKTRVQFADINAVNDIAYDFATGVYTFSAGANLAANRLARNSYPIGSYVNSPMFGWSPKKVLAHGDALPNDATLTIAIDVGRYSANINGTQSDIEGQLDHVLFPPVEDKRANTFEICFQMPMGMFRVAHGIPGCRHQIVMTPMPNTSFKTACVESMLGTVSKVPGTQYEVNVIDMYLNIYQVEGPSQHNFSFLLDMDELGCQQETPAQGFGPKSFEVPASTYALTLAFQDARAKGNNTLISGARFIAYNDLLSIPVSLNLKRFYIQYAGQQFPQPDADPSYSNAFLTDNALNIRDTELADLTTERYLQSLMHSGQYFSECPESFDEYQGRGPYYHFATPKDASDMSTRVTVSQEFSSNVADNNNIRVLLFHHSKRVARVTLTNGVATDVQTEDA